MLSSQLRRRRIELGFTLIEVLVTLALIAILAGIAYPSYQQQIRQSRRFDAYAALIKLQWAEERWRSNNRSYATLAELGVPATSEHGHYALQVVSSEDDGYSLLAVARGPQSGDASCRYIKMSVSDTTVSKASGPDENTGNSVTENRRCWPY